MHPGSWAADQSAHLSEVLGVGAQAGDLCTHLPGVFGPVRPGIWATDLGAHQRGFRCVLRQLIWCSQSRG